MVSDTWSTDVLASDSEIVEQQDRIPFPVPPEQVASVLPTEPMPIMLDISETASEAWSTDVLASDSERLTEVDTDDTASVARCIHLHLQFRSASIYFLYNHQFALDIRAAGRTIPPGRRSRSKVAPIPREMRKRFSPQLHVNSTAQFYYRVTNIFHVAFCVAVAIIVHI